MCYFIPDQRIHYSKKLYEAKSYKTAFDLNLIAIASQNQAPKSLPFHTQLLIQSRKILYVVFTLGAR